MDTPAFFLQSEPEASKPLTEYDLDDFEASRKPSVIPKNNMPELIYRHATPSLLRFLAFVTRVYVATGRNEFLVSFDRLGESIHRVEKKRIAKRTLTRLWSVAENGILALKDENGRPLVSVSRRTTRNCSRLTINPLIFNWYHFSMSHNSIHGPKRPDDQKHSLNSDPHDSFKRVITPETLTLTKMETQNDGYQPSQCVAKTHFQGVHRTPAVLSNSEHDLNRKITQREKIQEKTGNVAKENSDSSRRSEPEFIRKNPKIPEILFLIRSVLTWQKKRGVKFPCKIKYLVNHARFELVKSPDLDDCVICWSQILKNWEVSTMDEKRFMIRQLVLPNLQPGFGEFEQQTDIKPTPQKPSQNEYESELQRLKSVFELAKKRQDAQQMKLILMSLNALKAKKNAGEI